MNVDYYRITSEHVTQYQHMYSHILASMCILSTDKMGKWGSVDGYRAVPVMCLIECLCGGGVFLMYEDFGRIIHSSPALFFFLVEVSSRTLIPLFGQDQSTVAQRAETTVTECSLASHVWARFLIGSHTMPGQRHSQPNPTLLGQGCTRVQV